MDGRFAGLSRITVLTMVVLLATLANPICTSLVLASQVSSELESERTDECGRDCLGAILPRQRSRVGSSHGWRVAGGLRRTSAPGLAAPAHFCLNHCLYLHGSLERRLPLRI